MARSIATTLTRPAVADPSLTLIGHPFATIGVGEQLRSYIAACRSVHLPHQVIDIFGYAPRDDADHCSLVAPVEIKQPGPGIRVFHVNGDEVDPVLRAFAGKGGDFRAGYNIIVPAWELPIYPAVWAEKLQQFDEVWALSRFISESLAAAGIKSTYIGQGVELPTGYFLPRKYFGIRESAFVMLHFADLSSYSARKNPDAVLAAYTAIRNQRAFEDIQLVLKVKNGDLSADDWLQPFRERWPEVVYIATPLSALETRSLINCCDCFASLHRAEGFGRGTGEAMSLGRLAMATGWSGNLDYMTRENSLLVDYQLVSVGHNEYPFGDGQVWAEPNIDHAVSLLASAIDDVAQRRAIAARGRRDIRLGYGYRAVGVRILERVSEIRAEIANRELHPPVRRPGRGVEPEPPRACVPRALPRPDHSLQPLPVSRAKPNFDAFPHPARLAHPRAGWKTVQA